MSAQKKWDELYEEASQEVLRWRRKHRKATMTEIEDTVDNELARMRAQMIQDLALASETADLGSMAKEERPKCPHCGEPLTANGKQVGKQQPNGRWPPIWVWLWMIWRSPRLSTNGRWKKESAAGCRATLY